MTRTTAGHEPVSQQVGSGNPSNSWPAVLTARDPGRGTRTSAGHGVRLGIGQLPTWSRVECWTPHSVRRHASPTAAGPESTQAQPQRYLGLSSSRSEQAHAVPEAANCYSSGDRTSACGAGATPRPRRRSADTQVARAGGGSKIQRRSSSPAADKLMPPPSTAAPYTRASNLRSASPLPPRSGSGASDAHLARPHPLRSAEDRAAGTKFSAAARAEKQRAASPHKVGPGSVMGLGVPDPKQQHHNQGGSGGGYQAGASTKPAPKLEVPRIYTTLSRKEKEEDFMAMKGTKLPQRPKRRPKNVEKTVNSICPGMWLTDVTRSRYEVREKKCPKKQQKNRGLKGLESMDSDSD